VNQPDERARVVDLAGETAKPETGLSPDGPGHSDIFSRLAADDESDLVGLVAYGLYQRQKRSWIADFREKEGRYPSPAEREAYAFSHRKDAVLALRSDAEGALAVFAERVIEEKIEELRADAASVQTQAVLTGIDTKLERLGGYGHHVVAHIVAFIILVGIVAFGTLAVKFEPTVVGVYHWIFGDAPKP